jgi:transposase-like protein
VSINKFIVREIRKDPNEFFLPIIISRIHDIVLFFGPVMVHYHCNASSYRELLGFIRQELGESVQLTLGSDGEKGTESAVKDIFPNSIHLYCTGHVKKNIERYLLKTQLILEDRQKLLDVIFDSSDALIQAETEHQYNERLNSLRDIYI